MLVERSVVSTSRHTRKTAPRDWLQLDQWRQPEVTKWKEESQLRFNVLMEGIKQYVEGKAISTYLRDNDVTWEEFLRAFNRCLARDIRGLQLGWHGLTPDVRVRTPVRVKDLSQSGRHDRGGLAGAMQKFLSDHPEIKSRLDLYLIENAKRVLGAESRLRQKSAHQFFIKLCEEAKIAPSEWPLSAAKKGRGAVRLYIDAFINTRYDDVVRTQYGQKAAAKSNTGTGHFTRLTASRFYDVAELDEHSAHFIGSIGIPTADGTRWMELRRLTLVVIADRKGPVLGMKVICRREADAEDMLDVFDAAFGGAPPHRYSEPKYESLKGGFPASLGDPFSNCAFNQLLVDSALAHLAEPVMSRARGVAGFDVNFGVVGRFERRPVIEGIFNAVERKGFHRLRNTTGTGPNDPRRQHPEKAAVTARIELSDLIDLVVAVLADANAHTGKPNFGRSHLDCLRDLASDADGFGMLFPVLPEPLPGQSPLSVSIFPVKVRGNKEKGRRPSVYFEEETYVGKALADRWDLVGKELFIHVRRANIRTIELRSSTGELVDTLTVTGRWRHSPHSLDLRRHINWLIRDGYLKVGYDEDPVHVHHELLKQRATRRRRSDRGTTQAMVAAHAEYQRAAEAMATDISGRELDKIIVDTKAQRTTPDAAPDEEDWRLDDLGAINGASK